MVIRLPKEVLHVIDVLNNNGYEAYAVGGCIRDSLLGIEPPDWDITTSAYPQAVKSLFEKTADTGIKHGTVTVIEGGMKMEVTTYREEGTYSDRRRPDYIEFTSSLKEDLKRRDFTVNAMAYHPRIGLVDYFNGMGDLQKDIIRCVGDAGERFREDALRMLRAVRFCIRLNYIMDNNTMNALLINLPLLSDISRERIRDEMVKILTSHNTKRINLLWDTGLLYAIIPQIQNDLLNERALSKSEKIFPLLQPNYIQRLAILFLLLDFESDQAITVLRDLRFDNRSVKITIKLLEILHESIQEKPYSVRKAISKHGWEVFNGYMEIKKAMLSVIDLDKVEEKKYKKTEKIYRQIKKNNPCLSIEELSLSGNDLIKIGISEGALIGSLMNSLLEEVLKRPRLNTRKRLIKIVRKYVTPV